MIWVFWLQMTALAQDGAMKDSFQVRYVAAGAIYLNGGREEGLSEGLKLTVKRVAPGEPALAAPKSAEAPTVSGPIRVPQRLVCARTALPPIGEARSAGA